MIIHAQQRAKKYGWDNHTVVSVRFVENDDSELEVDDPKRALPTVLVEQNNHMVFPDNTPVGLVHGEHMYGTRPRNNYEARQVQRDWGLIRSHSGSGDVYLDYWPPLCMPIVALIEGRKEPVEGMLIQHIRKSNDKDHTSYVFAELLREGDTTGALLMAGIETRYQSETLEADGVALKRLYALQEMNSVYAWADLNKEGYISRPIQIGSHETDLFLDVKFDKERNVPLSMAIVTKLGTVYYAFDTKAFESCTDEFIKGYIEPELLNVPPRTIVHDTNRYGLSGNDAFRTWIMGVLENEVQGRDVTFHSCDVDGIGYFTKLMASPKARQSNRIIFDVEHIDPYPTPIKDSVQNNAAWDAVAVWHKLGYYEFAVMSQVMGRVSAANQDSDERKKLLKNAIDHDMIAKQLEAAPRVRDYTLATGAIEKRNSQQQAPEGFERILPDLVVPKKQVPSVNLRTQLENGTRPIHPGEFLNEEFILPSGKSLTDISIESKISRSTLMGLVNRNIDLDQETAAKLSAYFGTAEGYWTNLMKHYEGDLKDEESNRTEVTSVFTQGAHSALTAACRANSGYEVEHIEPEEINLAEVPSPTEVRAMARPEENKD